MQQQVYNKLQQVYNTASEQHQVQHQVQQVYTILYINILYCIQGVYIAIYNCNTLLLTKAFFSFFLKLNLNKKQIYSGPVAGLEILSTSGVVCTAPGVILNNTKTMNKMAIKNGVYAFKAEGMKIFKPYLINLI